MIIAVVPKNLLETKGIMWQEHVAADLRGPKMTSIRRMSADVKIVQDVGNMSLFVQKKTCQSQRPKHKIASSEELSWDDIIAVKRYSL